ncbi:MAG: hypothetical protein KatS3mg051_1471 [Anaerolineae bacterium]|nr:MAG: hypothetical protein KatS3mg051_1471 [Anaerolineae bacterium]
MAQGMLSTQNEVLRELETEYENIRKRVQENQRLIEQTQLEVTRMRERTRGHQRAVESRGDQLRHHTHAPTSRRPTTAPWMPASAC